MGQQQPNLSKFILFHGGNIGTMEVSYGIGTNNRYALFYDENEDPMDALKSTQVKEAAVASIKKTAEKDSKQDKTKPAEVKPKSAASAPSQAVKKGFSRFGLEATPVSPEPYEHIRDPPSPTLHPRLLLQQLLADRMDRKEERKITKYGRCHYVDPTSFLKTFLSHFFFSVIF